MKWLLLLLAALGLAELGSAKPNSALSVQYHSFTSNAGGQEIYGLRYRWRPDREISTFLNKYLYSGDWPMFGASYSWRTSRCVLDCSLELSLQGGVGGSSSGPFIELSSGLVLFWTVRLDMSSHFYFSSFTPIIWNIPLWLGLTIPF